MRILAFFFHFPPISGGGVVVIADIMNTLAEMGHDVTVLTPNLKWAGPIYEPKINSKVEVIRVETPSSSNMKIAARRCQGSLKKMGEKIGLEKKFDLIFTIFHPFHLAPNAAVFCAKKLGIPSIIKIDDAVYAKSSGLKSLQRRIEKRFSSKSLEGATEILVLNEYMKKTVIRSYNIPEKKISIMPNGIDETFFQVKDVKREEKIVFSGVMYYHRGLDILLEAVEKVIKKIPNARFVFLGSGPEEQKLREVVSKKNLGSNVEFKGWVDRNDIPMHLASASVGIGPLRLSSITENSIPIKVLEYMASSLPIIAKRGTLSKDVLEHGKNGFFIEDADELANRIIELLENQKAVKEFGLESFNMVKKFSWQNLIKSMLEKYQ